MHPIHTIAVAAAIGCNEQMGGLQPTSNLFAWRRFAITNNNR